MGEVGGSAARTTSWGAVEDLSSESLAAAATSVRAERLSRWRAWPAHKPPSLAVATRPPPTLQVGGGDASPKPRSKCVSVSTRPGDRLPSSGPLRG
jgi:hypothetical protein